MHLRSAIIFCLLLPFPYQSPQDTIRRHYESAETARQAGNLEAAQFEYAAILGEGYRRLSRIHFARSEYRLALTVFEPAKQYRPEYPELIVDLAIAYFGT